MTDVTTTTEFEYCYVDTREWFAAVAEDVSAYWLGIIERCARHDETDTRSFYSSQSVSTWNLREARDRITKALIARDPQADPAHGHTSNSDTNFYDNFGYNIVPHIKDGMNWGWLIFVSMGDYNDSGADIVLRVDSFDEAWQVIDPEIGYYCQTCKEWGQTRDGGCTFETDSGETRRGVIVDGQATCSKGHAVTLSAQTAF